MPLIWKECAEEADTNWRLRLEKMEKQIEEDADQEEEERRQEKKDQRGSKKRPGMRQSDLAEKQIDSKRRKAVPEAPEVPEVAAIS